MDCFDCIFISTNDLLWPIWYQYQCSHCFHDFSVAVLVPRVLRAWNLIGTPVRNRRRFFLWEKVLFCREVICFLINNLFGNVFQKTPTLKRYLSSWKRHFLVWKFKENEVFIIPAYFNVFIQISVFSLFKLIN